MGTSSGLLLDLNSLTGQGEQDLLFDQEGEGAVGHWLDGGVPRIRSPMVSHED